MAIVTLEPVYQQPLKPMALLEVTYKFGRVRQLLSAGDLNCKVLLSFI